MTAQPAGRSADVTAMRAYRALRIERFSHLLEDADVVRWFAGHTAQVAYDLPPGTLGRVTLDALVPLLFNLAAMLDDPTLAHQPVPKPKPATPPPAPVVRDTAAIDALRDHPFTQAEKTAANTAYRAHKAGTRGPLTDRELAARRAYGRDRDTRARERRATRQP